MARTVKLLKNGADPVGAPDFTLPVSILAQIIESLKVDIVAQSIPMLNINLASVGDVTLNVNITGTPTINVQTSGGANIVIDKLTQGAYTERQSTLANNGETATMSGSNYTYRKGKFFPRGCRGYVNNVSVYCDNSDSASHTFTVYFAVAPGMGPIFSVTISVSGNSSAVWRTATVRRFWNYDSMFVYVRCDSDIYGNVGQDNGTPYDGYYSSDEVTWVVGNLRYWIRVGVTGETVGDLPVSGTVNTVEIPPVTSKFVYLAQGSIAGGQTATLLNTVYGTGKLTCFAIMFYMQSGSVPPGSCYLRLIVDGVLFEVNMDVLYRVIYDVKTVSPVSFNSYDITNQYYSLAFNFPVCFRRSLKIEVRNDSASGNLMGVRGIVAYDLLQ
jgi:hypothetical protein